MDAATPFRRTPGLAGLLVLIAAGCHSADGDRSAYRGQSPSEPVPGLPVAPLAPPTPPAAPPVQGAVVTASAKSAGAAPAPMGDPRIKVVAVVGLRNTVTDQEVWEAVRQRVQDYLHLVDGPKGQQVVKDDEKAREVYEDELRRIIERELVLDEMETKLKKAGKTQVMETIREFAGDMADRRIKTFKARSKATTDDELRAFLAIQGLTPAVVRRQMQRQIMADEYVRNSLKERGKSVGLGDVNRYYEAHPGEFTTADRVKWLDIFVSAAKHPSREAARAHAEQVRAQAAAGADFLTLCKAHDNGVAAHQKGEGIGEERGKVQPAEVEPAVWAARPGEVGPVVETPAGFHVVKVAERQQAGVRPFDQALQDEIREKLMRQLQASEYRRIVNELWQRGVWRVIHNP
jgi:parvulin-like peptidyl-prolyl isomerase